jgi:hypothetical protein
MVRKYIIHAFSDVFSAVYFCVLSDVLSAVYFCVLSAAYYFRFFLMIWGLDSDSSPNTLKGGKDSGLRELDLL